MVGFNLISVMSSVCLTMLCCMQEKCVTVVTDLETFYNSDSCQTLLAISALSCPFHLATQTPVMVADLQFFWLIRRWCTISWDCQDKTMG